MKLYRTPSIFAIRTLRRIRYGRGAGVHSPYGYFFTTQITGPRYEYYDDDFLAAWHETQPQQGLHARRLDLDVGKLWYRMCARMRPIRVAYVMVEEWDAPFYGIRATPGAVHVLGEEGNHPAAAEALQDFPLLQNGGKGAEEGADLLFTDSPIVAERYLQTAQEGQALLLLRQKHTRRAIENLVEGLDRGLVMDFYDCLVIVAREKYHYLYRSTL